MSQAANISSELSFSSWIKNLTENGSRVNFLLKCCHVCIDLRDVCSSICKKMLCVRVLHFPAPKMFFTQFLKTLVLRV